MCRSIKKLRRPNDPPSQEEFEAAALQFVRKVSGYRKPSKVNETAFNEAVSTIASATKQLLNDLNKGKLTR